MAKKLQTESTIEYLKVDDLEVDPAYQRGLDQRRADEIAKTFEPARLGTVVVSRREDGTNVVIDGQTRCAGACGAGHGDTLVRCEVFTGLTRQKEAELFLKLNNGRKPVGALDKYKARLVAEEPVAMEIERIVRGRKLRIGVGQRARVIQAIHAVESVHRRQKNLGRTLDVLVRWDEDDASVFDGDVLKAVSLFLAHYPEAEDRRLVEVLRTVSPKALAERIQRDRSLDRAVSLAEAACCRILPKYNARLKNKLPPFTRRIAHAAKAA
jgi:hypothetical protein